MKKTCDNSRSPIITVAGHIDHGKTTFLNYISANKNPQKEYSGITQHIKAYYVNTKCGYMTFLDTPGHFAFNSNRENCIKISDIVLLIIAIDDGIKPQTIESLNISKRFNIPVVVALNKIDKFNYFDDMRDKIFTELTSFGLIPEEWGGDTIVVPISAKSGLGVDLLIDMLKLQTEMLDLKVSGDSYGIILENKIEVGKGHLSTLILKSGLLKQGDFILVNNVPNKVKNIYDCNKKIIKLAYPSLPIEVTGITSKIMIGDRFEIIQNKDFKKSHLVLNNKESLSKVADIYTVDNLINDMKKSTVKKMNIILKVDVLGSIKVLSDVLEKLSTESVVINIVKADIGNFNESDIDLAAATNSIMLGFNVRLDNKLKMLVSHMSVEVYIFNVIYALLDFVKDVMSKKFVINAKVNICGIAEIKKVFSHKDHFIAGCTVTFGKIKQGSHVKIFRNEVVVYDGNIESVKIFKETVKEVKVGCECGIVFKNYNKFQLGDSLETYYN